MPESDSNKKEELKKTPKHQIVQKVTSYAAGIQNLVMWGFGVGAVVAGIVILPVLSASAIAGTTAYSITKTKLAKWIKNPKVLTLAAISIGLVATIVAAAATVVAGIVGGPPGALSVAFITGTAATIADTATNMPSVSIKNIFERLKQIFTRTKTVDQAMQATEPTRDQSPKPLHVHSVPNFTPGYTPPNPHVHKKQQVNK